ncbi:MAG: nicotinate-nucleotide--dimethylbenzimidazole phosphoribosyltransferase [Sporomusaceae bacterium]|nr:nicotinate-nucleotide--dimethylbenzimidazole phosphoribosyltransferase [Sporomusaceae bacterium]
MEYQEVVDQLLTGAAKPPKSLGLLEKHLRKMLLAWGELQPECKPYHLIFAADNGVVEEAVVSYPADITYLQAQNMVAGKATISCFCHCSGIPYAVVDVGVKQRQAVGLDRKVAAGTKNFLKEPAMTADEFERAWSAGREMAAQAAKDGYNLISLGEMGIGNTTTSAAVLHALTGILPEFIVGYGASVDDDAVLKRKRIVVAKGVELHKPLMRTARDIIRCVGGFDIAAICAAMLECARQRLPFVIDGFITAVAYACAAQIDRGVEAFSLPSHLSREPGMTYALLLGNIAATDAPIRAELALGEGSGAVLMASLLKTMHYTITHMARLEDFPLSPPAPQRLA